MTKTSLIARLAEVYPSMHINDADRIINIFFGEMTKALAQGGRVELRGFGAFDVKKRAARTGRNPRTGESVFVAERLFPYFKAGKQLKEWINEGKNA